MPSPDPLDVSVSVIVRVGRGTPPVPFYDAVWHEPLANGKRLSAKVRIGKAWLDPDGVDDRGRARWKKRRGRVREGFFDEHRAYAAVPNAVAAWRARQAKKDAVPDPAELVTVRALAREWLEWLENVKGASPSTVRDYSAMLREPGTRAARGSHKSLGRIMAAFGDRPASSLTAREVSAWLRGLDDDGLAAKTVNKYRQLLRSMYVYGQRRDTYELADNPVKHTDKRREPPQARLDYFEVEEVEALARAAAAGPHRKPANYLGRPNVVGQAELDLRAQLDRQDGELFRVLLYTGLRIGEAIALRWRDVEFLPDMSGGVFDVRHAVSAGQEKPPKSWKPRTVPVPRPAVEALARLQRRPHFTDGDDYVFANRIGGRLDDSSIRKRYKAAREAAGLREVKLHGLRHAAGSTIAHSAGVVVARDVLGHAQLSTTSRYLHGKADARAVAVMNAAFGVAPDGNAEKRATRDDDLRRVRP